MSGVTVSPIRRSSLRTAATPLETSDVVTVRRGGVRKRYTTRSTARKIASGITMTTANFCAGQRFAVLLQPVGKSLAVTCSDDAGATLLPNERHEREPPFEVLVGEAEHQTNLMVLELPWQL